MSARHLHLDPFSGIAGDMLLGLLVDLGLPPAALESLPARLGLAGVNLTCGPERRGALVGSRVHVIVRGTEEGAARPVFHRVQGERGGLHPGLDLDAHGHAHHHDEHHHQEGQHHSHGSAQHAHGGRSLADVRALIDGAALPPRADALARRAFELLFAAEATVHGRTIDEVHLHEAGADDALVDICGAALGLVELGIESVSCTVPIPLGGGAIHCAHGVLPVPGPAVAELLRGLPVAGGPVERELVTPTGAALLRAIVDRFGPAPPLVLERAGHGAGTRDDAHLPNVLRGLLGRAAAGPRERLVSVLETALDDVLPQDVPVLQERLLQDGARDAFVVPVAMKKGRPGFLLVAICDPADEARLAGRLLADGPTLGVRIRREARLEWDRDTLSVETPWGPVRVKRALDDTGRVLRGRPEFEDCRRAADEGGVPVDDVRRAAQRAFDDTTNDTTNQD